MSARTLWPKIPAPFVRAMLAGHSALGLAFAALIYLVCLSGTVSVFAMEFQRWETPVGPTVAEATPAAVQTALVESVARAPDLHYVSINPPTEFKPRFLAYVDRPSGDEVWALDAAGHIVGDAKSPWTEFLTYLHFYLHLPPTWGIFVVGLTGVALLSSLVSGLLSHPRVFRDAFHLRWGGSRRLQEADLHNRIGVWALPFHVTISLTGALLGLATVIVGILAMVVFNGDVNKAYALFIAPEPAHDERPAPVPNVAPLVVRVMAERPDAHIRNVFVEDPTKMAAHITIGADGKSTLARESFAFDRKGTLLGGEPYGARNVGERVYSSIGTIHFGFFGGWPLKVAYVVLGLGLTVVTTSGVTIWLARRRDKGRPAPAWERIWVATVWSQPLAFAATALISFLTSLPLTGAWLVITALSLAVSALATPARLSIGFRLASGLLTLAMAAWHAAVIAPGAVDGQVWIVDAAIAVLGVGLAGSILLGRDAVSPLAWRRRTDYIAP